jgi:hypothetical protein
MNLSRVNFMKKVTFYGKCVALETLPSSLETIILPHVEEVIGNYDNHDWYLSATTYMTLPPKLESFLRPESKDEVIHDWSNLKHFIAPKLYSCPLLSIVPSRLVTFETPSVPYHLMASYDALERLLYHQSTLTTLEMCGNQVDALQQNMMSLKSLTILGTELPLPSLPESLTYLEISPYRLRSDESIITPYFPIRLQTLIINLNSSDHESLTRLFSIVPRNLKKLVMVHRESPSVNVPGLRALFDLLPKKLVDLRLKGLRCDIQNENISEWLPDSLTRLEIPQIYPSSDGRPTLPIQSTVYNRKLSLKSIRHLTCKISLVDSTLDWNVLYTNVTHFTPISLAIPTISLSRFSQLKSLDLREIHTHLILEAPSRWVSNRIFYHQR